MTVVGGRGRSRLRGAERHSIERDLQKLLYGGGVRGDEVQDDVCAMRYLTTLLPSFHSAGTETIAARELLRGHLQALTNLADVGLVEFPQAARMHTSGTHVSGEGAADAGNARERLTGNDHRFDGFASHTGIDAASHEFMDSVDRAHATQLARRPQHHVAA